MDNFQTFIESTFTLQDICDPSIEEFQQYQNYQQQNDFVLDFLDKPCNVEVPFICIDDENRSRIEEYISDEKKS